MKQLDLFNEIIVDNFTGDGGVSTEIALNSGIAILILFLFPFFDEIDGII